MFTTIFILGILYGLGKAARGASGMSRAFGVGMAANTLRRMLGR